MKRIVLLVLITLWGAISGIIHAQTEQEIEEISTLLKQGEYSLLVNKVCSMRENEYYKNAFMDYCLAFSYCQLGYNQISAEWFDHLMDNYNSISSAKRQELNQLKAKCQNLTEPKSTAADNAEDMFKFLTAMNPEGYDNLQAGIEIHQKMGIPNVKERVAEVDYEHAIFNAKNPQFTQRQKSEAYNYYQGLQGLNSLKCDSTRHLLFLYPPDTRSVRSQTSKLEDYYEYYRRSFDLGESNRLITVFYCEHRSTLDTIARKVHNINVPESTYGYASSSDLVMLGIASPAWLGAMKHELFHLMIRSFIGDIPAWLDEGIACCYESSSLMNNQVKVNMDNYRTELLRELNMMRYSARDSLPLPTVELLTNFNWQRFSGNPGDLKIKASINYSLSFVFVKFLMDNGILPQMVYAFRNRSIKQMQIPVNGGESLTILQLQSSNEILTRIMHTDMNQLQSYFENYCKKILRLNPYKN
jgi:hypothetical protein